MKVWALPMIFIISEGNTSIIRFGRSPVNENLLRRYYEVIFMKKAKKIIVRVLSYLLVAALSAGGVWHHFRDEHKLEELAHILDTQFIGDADMTAVGDAGAQAMIAALGDRWSYYIPESQYRAHVENQYNTYVGIGITIVSNADKTGMDVPVVEPDGPGQKAGVRPGDVITAVDGKSVANMSAAEVKVLVQGEADTQVVLTILRDGNTLEIPVTRGNLQVQVAKGQMLAGNVGLVTIKNFNYTCSEMAIEAIEELRAQGATALILDVRNNPGGFKSELVKLLDYLLPEGPLFRSFDNQGNEEVDMSAEGCLEMPMAVLMNGNSYSAAEFFAAALHEYEWAATVGEPTTGKGYFQSTITLNDGSAVNLSIGKYTTPNNVNLTLMGGLIPDVAVDVDDKTFNLIYSGMLDPMEDPQVLAAIAALQEN